MYTFESRVRYSETDETGRLSVTGIMNYFQDCSTFQSEDLHMGISYLEEEKRAWWLNSWQIVIDRYPSLGRIQISTIPMALRGLRLQEFSDPGREWSSDSQGRFLLVFL